MTNVFNTQHFPSGTVSCKYPGTKEQRFVFTYFTDFGTNSVCFKNLEDALEMAQKN